VNETTRVWLMIGAMFAAGIALLVLAGFLVVALF
jgi:hypothetical protein